MVLCGRVVGLTYGTDLERILKVWTAREPMHFPVRAACAPVLAHEVLSRRAARTRGDPSLLGGVRVVTYRPRDGELLFDVQTGRLRTRRERARPHA
jgi:hypothetical protein